MALSIKELFGELSRGRVILRGKSIEVRGLSAAETQEILAILRPPPVPFGPDPTAGSKAPHVERPDTPKYRVEYAAWATRYSAAKIIVSADMRSADGNGWRGVPAEKRREWLTEMVSQLCATLSDEEIGHAAEEVNRLSNPASPDMLRRAERMLALSGPELEEAEAAAEAEKVGARRYALTMMGMLMRALADHKISLEEADRLEPGMIAALLAEQRLKMADAAARGE